MERRHFSRIPFANRADLVAEDTRISGEVTDLSLNGLRLETPETLPDKTDVIVHLQLGADDTDFVLEIPGRVLRYTQGALAVQFNLLTIEDANLIILKRILALFHGDAAVVEREYKNYLDMLLKRKKRLQQQKAARARGARTPDDEA